MAQRKIPCLLMRGGTSKAACFLADDLPSDPAQRDAVLLAAMGSPDARQIDGIGGKSFFIGRIHAAIERKTACITYFVGDRFIDRVINKRRTKYV